MDDLNIVIFTARVSHDPDVERRDRGGVECRFGVALSRFYRGEAGNTRHVTTVFVSTWGRLAERCAHALTRGARTP